MKKIVLVALGACMFIATADAQKQAGGEKNLQVLFAPLGGSPVSLNGGGISFRKFNATGTSAWRVNFFFGMFNSEDVIDGSGVTTHYTQPTDTTITFVELHKTESHMNFSIRPGYEKHFAGTERLSPYIGAEIDFGMGSSKDEEEWQDGFNEPGTTFNTVPGPTADSTTFTHTTEGSEAFTRIGVNLIAGFDYYFAKNLSIGGEFGFGFSTTSAPDIEETDTHEEMPSITTIQGSSMNIGPNVIGQLKLSWLFN